MRFSCRILVVLIISLLAVSCENPKKEKNVSQNEIDKQGEKTTLDFATIKREILTPRCISCHTGRHVAYENYSVVRTSATKILSRVKSTNPSRRMPKGQAPLPQDLIDKLSEWVNAGAPEFASSPDTAPIPEQIDRNISKYNLSNNLGLSGYDPVSYFSEGGATPQPGLQEYSAEYGGVTYMFSSEANRSMFFTNPTKYEPTYGGWCAWAMVKQAYVGINPAIFTLTKRENGVSKAVLATDSSARRLHLFISRGAKARFDQDLTNNEVDADDFWGSESGEAARF